MTIFPFQPSRQSAPQFTPTFDGQQYLVQVTASVRFGQRYYVQCSALDGTPQFFLPLIESDVGKAIESLTWDELTGEAQGVTSAPHGYEIGSSAELTISGASPSDYNGTFYVLITGPNSFSFPLPLSTDPGASTVPGVLSYDISMTAGYFNSTLVYRNSQFEVNP